MGSDLEFRHLLIELADDLDESNKKKFIFMLGSILPKEMQERSMLDIFNCLIDQAEISAENCSLLQQLFESLKLRRLEFKVARYMSCMYDDLLCNLNKKYTNRFILSANKFEIDCFSETMSSNSYSVIADILNDDSMNLQDAMLLPGQNLWIKDSKIRRDDLDTFAKGNWSEEFLDRIKIRTHPHAYQRELIQNAIQVGNTIIILGNTSERALVIGLLLKYYSMEKALSDSRSQRKFRAVVVVTQRLLLMVRRNELVQVSDLTVDIIGDGTTVNVVDEKMVPDVFICTPQKLLNHLVNNQLSIEEIDILCFDECNDQQASYQYNQLMQYIFCQSSKSIPVTQCQPKIIALTTVFSCVGLSSNLIVRNLVNLCATFNCTSTPIMTTSFAEEKIDNTTQNSVEVEIICVKKSEIFLPSGTSIKFHFEDFLLELFSKQTTNPSKIFTRKIPTENGYEQELILLQQEAQKNKDFPTVILLDYVLIMFRSFRWLHDLTSELVLSHAKLDLTQKYKTRQHPTAIDTYLFGKCQEFIDNTLKLVLESPEQFRNPKLEKLAEVIGQHFDQSNGQILILVPFISYSEKIFEFLQSRQDTQKYARIGWLSSQQIFDSSNLGDNNQNIVDKFHKGTHNVLISTDPMKRTNLNIPDGSLIIRYEFVSDKFNKLLILENGQYRNVLITEDGSDNHSKELELQSRKRILQQVPVEWKEMNLDRFNQQVLEERARRINKWNQELNMKVSLNEASSTSTLSGKILCRSCGYRLGCLSQLRRFHHFYFVNESDFYNCIEEIVAPDPKIYRKTIFNGKFRCGNKACRADLGSMVMIVDASWKQQIYALKCKKIKIEEIDAHTETTQVHVKDQWEKLPFFILEFRMEADYVDVNIDNPLTN